MSTTARSAIVLLLAAAACAKSGTPGNQTGAAGMPATGAAGTTGAAGRIASGAPKDFTRRCAKKRW